jgi:toxin-antitoxin system PIN domain toxin
MILPDINLLLYAYNPHVPQHVKAAAWWEAALNDEELVGLPNEVALGFVRIAAHPRLGPATIPLNRVREVVDSWLELPNVRVLTPAPDHFARVTDLLADAMASGAVVSDAVLAAYAIANRAVLHTNDADFARFPGLEWSNPLVA